MRRAKPGRTGFSYLKEPVELTVNEDMIHGKSGACEIYLLYGAVEKLYELENLFVFYDMIQMDKWVEITGHMTKMPPP